VTERSKAGSMTIPDLKDHPWAHLHDDLFANEPTMSLPPTGEGWLLDHPSWTSPVAPRPAPSMADLTKTARTHLGRR